MVIIGTYHSHGQFDAYISPTDNNFLKSRAGMEFFLVYSPETKKRVLKFKYFDTVKKLTFIKDANVQLKLPVNLDLYLN